MLRKLLLSGIVIVLVACQPRIPDLITGLTIGNFDSTTVHQVIYSPIFEMLPQANQVANIELDMDQDNQQDIEFKYAYEFQNLDVGPTLWDITATSLITVSILNNDFRISLETKIDTTYFCQDEIGPDYVDWEYTDNTGITCELEGNASGIRQIIQGLYCQNFQIGGSINSTLDWQVGEFSLARHEYHKQGGSQNNETFDTRKDLRLGLAEWANETYLGICKVDTPRNKYGFVKFQLVQIDESSWKLQVLETVLQK